ncbi:sodium channel subunit beta-3-like isoform X2 [Thunnus albacares]|uniref:sodium channel subunit beta-3-like isoform X2 n=1 Tax=Thunnus albacares TaxID=8236 RepID=UPI001CF631B6|nr:sodium channel subunit beta-3-like isoform X2 [Thunnus albacares]
MQSVLLKWKIMLLCWSMLLLCLSTNAENIAMCRESGESITLKCSSAGCLNNIKEFVGMYLYRSVKNRENVIYYHPNPNSVDKITPGIRYKDRIQTNGSLENHTITISNLTTNDSGVYSCVYIKFPTGEAQCNVYTVAVKVAEVTPRHTPDEVADMHCENQQCPLLVSIVATCAISMLVMMISNLLIVPRVKRWICSRMTTRAPQAPNEYVYEIMTKNGVRPPAAPEDSVSSPYNFA